MENVTATNSDYLFIDEQRRLLERFDDLKLDGMVQELKEQFSAPGIFRELSFEKRLEKLLDSQERTNHEKKFKALYKRSRLHAKIYLDQLLPNVDNGLTHEILAILAQTAYIYNRTNIIITGPTGIGKTTLAAGAALCAMQHGLSAIFYRFSDLKVILETKDDAAFFKFKSWLARFNLLILDELGMIRIDDLCAIRLYEIINAHYTKGATIVTSQLKKANLPECIPQGPVRDSLTDRLLRENDLEVVLTGPSWRGTSQELKGE